MSSRSFLAIFGFGRPRPAPGAHWAPGPFSEPPWSPFSEPPWGLARRGRVGSIDYAIIVQPDFPREHNSFLGATIILARRELIFGPRHNVSLGNQNFPRGKLCPGPSGKLRFPSGNGRFSVLWEPDLKETPRWLIFKCAAGRSPRPAKLNFGLGTNYVPREIRLNNYSIIN